MVVENTTVPEGWYWQEGTWEDGNILYLDWDDT